MDVAQPRIGPSAWMIVCGAARKPFFWTASTSRIGKETSIGRRLRTRGIDFAFTKATEGVDFVDSRFHVNMQGARAAGVPIGPYHFCRLDSFATNPLDPVNEANDFLEAILPYYQTGQHLPPVADVERFRSSAQTTRRKRSPRTG